MNYAYINVISRKRLPQTMFCFVWDKGGVIFSLTPPQESAVYLMQTLYYAAPESDWGAAARWYKKAGSQLSRFPFPQHHLHGIFPSIPHRERDGNGLWASYLFFLSWEEGGSFKFFPPKFRVNLLSNQASAAWFIAIQHSCWFICRM